MLQISLSPKVRMRHSQMGAGKLSSNGSSILLSFIHCLCAYFLLILLTTIRAVSSVDVRPVSSQQYSRKSAAIQEKLPVEEEGYDPNIGNLFGSALSDVSSSEYCMQSWVPCCASVAVFDVRELKSLPFHRQRHRCENSGLSLSATSMTDVLHCSQLFRCAEQLWREKLPIMTHALHKWGQLNHLIEKNCYRWCTSFKDNLAVDWRCLKHSWRWEG